MYKLKDSSSHHDLHARAGKDRWLLSYSDYITLLFALFVLLYALGLQDKSDFQRVLQSLSTMFLTDAKQKQAESLPLVLKDVTPDPYQVTQKVYNTDPVNSQVKGEENQPAATDAVSDDMKDIQRQMNKTLKDLVDAGLASVRLDKNWLIIELNSGLLFDSASAVATSSAQVVIEELVPILSQTQNYIRVRGYTDSLSIHTEYFPSNWELSAARSASIVRLLETAGIESARMALEGYGQYSPFADNSTAQGRQQNRKVVIAVSNELYEPVALPEPEPAAVDNLTEVEKKAAQQEQEQNKIRVIRLPHGGIRITTRPPEPGEEEPPSQ